MNTTTTIVSPHTFYGNYGQLILVDNVKKPPPPWFFVELLGGQLRQRSNELTVKMTNLTSNTRQPLGVEQGREWGVGRRGEGRRRGGWLKKKRLREGPVFWNGGVFVFFLSVFWWLTIFVFFSNSGWCFRDKPSTASSRSALLEATGTGSRTQGKSLSNKLLRIKCCFISVDESFFFGFSSWNASRFLGFNSTSCVFASYLGSFVFPDPRLFSQLLREREDRLAFQHQVRNQDAAGWSPWWMEKVYTYYVDRFALAKILVVFINDIWLVP